jgi:hypothetical protein
MVTDVFDNLCPTGKKVATTRVERDQTRVPTKQCSF